MAPLHYLKMIRIVLRTTNENIEPVEVIRGSDYVCSDFLNEEINRMGADGYKITFYKDNITFTKHNKIINYKTINTINKKLFVSLQNKVVGH